MQVNSQGLEEGLNQFAERKLLEETGKKAEDLKIRFWKKVSKQKEDECWIWNAYKHKKGYGYFHANGSVMKSHRISFILENKTLIPKGMCICHSCDNPSCVNPNHLWMGTNMDNIKDSLMKGRRIGLRGEKNNSCKLKSKEVLKIRELFLQKIKAKHIAKMFNIGISMIYAIKQRRNWKHI